MGFEGCTEVPKGADGKAFSGRGYNGTGLKHKRMETEPGSTVLGHHQAKCQP